jgi:hypothetical protein
MNTDETMHSSKGHNPGSRDEHEQGAEKSKANSPAVAGENNRDEDAADPERAANDTSKSLDRDQFGIDLGLDGDEQK